MYLRKTILAISTSIAALIAQPVLANECMALWIERNQIFNDVGYCFKTELGSEYFDNSDCSTTQPRISPANLDRVNGIKARESGLSCTQQTASWTVASLRSQNSNTAGVQPVSTKLSIQQVVEMQIYLESLGYYQGQVDGQMGPGTTDAVNAFLRANGLPPQAVASILTYGQVRSAFLQPSAPAFAVTPANKTSAQATPGEIVIDPVIAVPVAPVPLPIPVTNNDPKKAFAFISPTIIRGSGPTPHGDALYDEFGLRIAFVELVSGYKDQKYRYAFVEEIKPNSVAARSGLKGNTVILRFDGGEPGFLLGSLHTLGTGIELEQATQEFLEALRKPDNYIQGLSVPLEELIAFRKLNFRDGGRSDATIRFMFERAKIEQHVGFSLDRNYLVTRIFADSPADLAGLRVGDVFDSLNSAPTDSVLSNLSRQLRWYSDVSYFADVSFLRNGQRLTLKFPGAAYGTTPSSNSLTDIEKAVFARLPEDLGTFFSYVYLENYERAKPFQMAIFDKHFEGSALALVSGAFGTSDNFRDDYERSRGRGIFSQYILIKTNEIGLCNEPGVPMRVEQKRYEVWVDGYGVETSARKEIEPNVYEFIVPARWSEHLKKNAPMGEARQWARDVKAFIQASGGCNSSILKQLEDNMLAYLSLG